jgi:dihydrodipicolinate synthase/N-acetylneuraminate lyase
MPVIAGVGLDIDGRADRAAAHGGADGIYFSADYPNADDEGLLLYYRAIASATSLGC